MNITCATLAASLKVMTAAASIMVTGACPAYVHITGAPSGSTFDFRAAPLTRLDLSGLSRITLKGIVASGSQWGGMYITGSDHVLVSSPQFHGGTVAITVVTSNFVELSAPTINGSRGDGFDIVGSTNVNIHDGSCLNNVISSGLHPDCIQMWGLPGHPLQHIIVQRMNVVGQTQGIDNFSGPFSTAGTADIQIMNNTVDIPFANCIVFKDVAALIITNNKCVTMPGGNQGHALIRVFDSPGAVVSGNVSI